MIPVALAIIVTWYLIRFGYQPYTVSLIQNRNFQKALDVCLRAQQSFPDDSFLLVYMADAYQGLGQFEKAIELADIAINYKERLPLAYLARTKAVIGIRAKEHERLIETSTESSDEAEGDGSKSVATNTDNIEAAIEYDRTIEAMDNFFRRPNLAPPFLQISLAYYLARLGLLDLAQEELDKTRNPVMDHARAYWFSNQARIHLLRGDKEAALEASTEAYAIRPLERAIVATHALMLLRNDRITVAAGQLDVAIKTRGDYEGVHAEAHYFRSELFERMGNMRQAEQEREIALRHGYIPYL